MKHFMNLQSAPFNAIEDGRKTVEMRLFDEKRRQVKVGDTIEFSRGDDGKVLKVAVLKVDVYKDFCELYSHYSKTDLGYSKDETANPQDMYVYYSQADIDKYGVVAITVCAFNKLSPALLTDSGICPTCFDKENDCCLYGDDSHILLYKNDIIECKFVARPRAEGHCFISTVEHFKDMSQIPDDLCEYVFKFAKHLMIAIKEQFGCESVYLCTMCDGAMNHFHVQLIPRYACEKRGSTNFVKERKEYVANDAILKSMRSKIEAFALNMERL